MNSENTSSKLTTKIKSAFAYARKSQQAYLDGYRTGLDDGVMVTRQQILKDLESLKQLSESRLDPHEGSGQELDAKVLSKLNEMLQRYEN